MCQGLHYGAAIFEGIRFYPTACGTSLFRLDDHMNRFFYSAGALGMILPFSRTEIMAGIAELIYKNAMHEGYIRPIAWYAEETLGVTPKKDARIDVAILVFPWQKGEKKALSIKVSPIMRIHPASTNVEAKLAGTYNNSQLALLDAQKGGYDDAILLDYNGNVAEASSSNIFVVTRDERICTPSRGTILSGITRDTALAIFKEEEIKAHEELFGESCLASAKEVFLCGTAIEIMPVVAVNGKQIGDGAPGEITQHISILYQNTVRGGFTQKWLAYI